MCRNEIYLTEKTPGELDLNHFKWNIINEIEFYKGRNGYLKELDEIFVEAVENLISKKTTR